MLIYLELEIVYFFKLFIFIKLLYFYYKYNLLNKAYYKKMNLLDERFDYTYSVSNRLLMPSKYISINNKKIKISLLVTNGFVKLYTLKGRIYWIQQGRNQDTLPDWKIHFNINHEDIPKAWNIISQNYISHKIKYIESNNKEIKDDIIISLKVLNTVLNKNFPEYMYGREITIYIYKYNKLLNEKDGKGVETNDEDENGKEIDKLLIFNKNEEESFNFWKNFLIDTENKLLKENIKTQVKNGCADGDLFLGKYCSLRNEEYYEEQYPPNDEGWNATKEKVPFNFIQIFMLRYYLVYKDKFFFKNIHYFSIIFLLIAIFVSFFVLKSIN